MPKLRCWEYKCPCLHPAIYPRVCVIFLLPGYPCVHVIYHSRGHKFVYARKSFCLRILFTLVFTFRCVCVFIIYSQQKCTFGYNVYTSIKEEVGKTKKLASVNLNVCLNLSVFLSICSSNPYMCCARPHISVSLCLAVASQWKRVDNEERDLING